jgi:DnaJ-domain-containing protein 1
MDLLDRIAALLRSLFADAGSTFRAADSQPGAEASRRTSRPIDPDLASAWEELDDYLGSPRAKSDAGRSRGGSGAGSRGPQSPPRPPEALRGDYANLEVPFGADIETVRRSYKRLVLYYHPDRHAGNPEKLRVATEITKKLNQSFERIRAVQERTGGSDR